MSTDKKYPEWRHRGRMIDVTYDDFSPNTLIQKINDVCDTLDAPREEIRVTFLTSDNGVEMYFGYVSPETERERKARLNQITWQEQQEREEFARLKEKYENE